MLGSLGQDGVSLLANFQDLSAISPLQMGSEFPTLVLVG